MRGGGVGEKSPAQHALSPPQNSNRIVDTAKWPKYEFKNQLWQLTSYKKQKAKSYIMSPFFCL